MMPLMMNGILAYAVISRISSTVLLPALGFIFFRKGRPAPSTSIAAANMPFALATSSFSKTASLFHGFIVGTDIPPIAALSLTADFIMSGSTPSPVKAITP